MNKQLKEALMASYNNGDEIVFQIENVLYLVFESSEDTLYYNIFEYIDDGNFNLFDGGSYKSSIEDFIQSKIDERSIMINTDGTNTQAFRLRDELKEEHW